jgi:hypothetical protein
MILGGWYKSQAADGNELQELFEAIKQAETILDLVITSEIAMTEKVEVMQHYGNSDSIIVWKLLCEVCIEKKQQPIRLFYTAKFDI